MSVWNTLKHMTKIKNIEHNIITPGIVSSTLSVPQTIRVPDYRPHVLQHLKQNQEIDIKTAQDVVKMRNSCKLARDILQFAKSLIEPGVTTDYIDQRVHNEIIKYEAYPSPMHYKGFPKSVCTSVNNVVCHGIPDCNKLVEGDIINVDVSVYLDGFHGDTSDTFAVGIVDEKAKLLIQVTQNSLAHAIEICKPGMFFDSIGSTIESYIKPYAYSICHTFVGHGIGNYFHGPPYVRHYRQLFPEKQEMLPGMVFTIEPIIMEGSNAVKVLSDGWTVVSKDGQRSAQSEHTILITENGSEILTL